MALYDYSPGASQHFMDALEHSELEAWRAKAISRSISKNPRLGGPGPVGFRFARRGSLLSHKEGLWAAGVVLSRLLLREACEDAVRALLEGWLIAMRRPNGKLWPLACGSVLRRLPAKGVWKVMSNELRQAGSGRQFDIGW